MPEDAIVLPAIAYVHSIQTRCSDSQKTTGSGRKKTALFFCHTDTHLGFSSALPASDAGRDVAIFSISKPHPKPNLSSDLGPKSNLYKTDKFSGLFATQRE